MKKIIRMTTVASSLKVLLNGQLGFLRRNGFEVVGISSPSRDLVVVGDREKIRTLALKMDRQISLVKDVIALIRCYIIFLREKPDMVHTHTPKAGAIGMVASYFARIPYRIHTNAGLPLLEEKGCKRWILNLVEKITYRCATQIYPNSVGLKNIILKNKLANINKLKVIGNGSSNGVDIEFFTPDFAGKEVQDKLRQKLGISSGDFVFIFVGRIVADKGINELIKAFESVSSREKNIKLLLVGPLEDEIDPLEEKTKKSIIKNKKILCVGYQEDVRPFLGISNFLVFPSYREGFPNAVLQAGAMGLGSIVSDINGCNEIIEDRVNGIIVPVKDIKALTKAMEEAKNIGDLLVASSSEIRALIKERYCQKKFWENMLNEYKVIFEV